VCKSPLALVLEHMPDGTLYDYLHKNVDITWSTRLAIALDIANGK